MTTAIVQKIPAKRFWIIAACVYLSLLYSTGLDYAFGPEQTITLEYFTGAHREPPIEDRLINDRAAYDQVFADRGSLEGKPIAAKGADFWKLADFYGDSGFYIMQSQSFFSSIAPYKYRLLPALLVGELSRVLDMPISITYAIFNVMLTFCTALVFTYYLRTEMHFTNLLALVGGMLFVSMIAVTSTLPFPMIEPASLFFIMLIFVAVIRKQALFFIVASILGVATKEILVVVALLWFIHNFSIHDLKSTHNYKTILISCVPIITFAAIRIIMGGSATEVNYGYDLLKGEIPRYGSRLIHFDRFLDLALRLFLSFSFLWLGLINIRKNEFLYRSSIIIPVVVMAAIVFSSRIERVLGIFFPIIIPAFLLFFAQGIQENSPSYARLVSFVHMLLPQKVQRNE